MSERLPRRPGGVVIRAAEAAAWSDGFAFLEAAREQADAILAQAEAAVAAARAEGYEAGRRDGEREAGQLVVRAAADVDRYLRTIDGELADLALAIARKILGDTFDPAALTAACAGAALAAFRDEQRVVLRVAPHLADEVRRLLAEQGGGARTVVVEPAFDMAEGRCSISSPAATMEIGLDAQLAAIRGAMTGEPVRP